MAVLFRGYKWSIEGLEDYTTRDMPSALYTQTQQFEWAVHRLNNEMKTKLILIEVAIDDAGAVEYFLCPDGCYIEGVHYLVSENQVPAPSVLTFSPDIQGITIDTAFDIHFAREAWLFKGHVDQSTRTPMEGLASLAALEEQAASITPEYLPESMRIPQPSTHSKDSASAT